MPPSYPKAGVIGWPVGHSLSPRLHGFWLRQYGIEGSYEALPVGPESLETALRGLQAAGFTGVNLTVPHKEAACGIVGTLDDIAKRVGAVNLVVVGDKGLEGRNTDVYGFTQNLLTSGFSFSGGAAFVLGAGGAARAVIVALQEMGFRDIRLTNRTLARAEKLAQEFATPACKIAAADWDAPQDMGEIELLVNTTSLGMKGQPELAFPLDTLSPQATVTDIVYAPLETDLLKQARQHGLKTIDGLGMLLHQAAPSFAAFFGMKPEVTPPLRDFILADRKE